jgi:hypothetical protein
MRMSKKEILDTRNYHRRNHLNAWVSFAHGTALAAVISQELLDSHAVDRKVVPQKVHLVNCLTA